MKFPRRTQDTTGRRGGRFLWGQKPTDVHELLERAGRLAGVTLGELALDAGEEAPPDLSRHKGWVGTLIERALGASAGSRALPDFPELSIELKTLPVDQCGRSLESTFVCTIELSQIADSEWEVSRLKKKLDAVLWVPVEGMRSCLVSERRIGTPFLWKPNEEELALLRNDWEQLCLLIAQGRTEEITGHLGEVLQVRPKAARGSSRRRTTDDEGALYDEQPKGFYLRARFTSQIVARNFGL
jgi:DNA mismatch repair protein MutH